MVAVQFHTRNEVRVEKLRRALQYIAGYEIDVKAGFDGECAIETVELLVNAARTALVEEDDKDGEVSQTSAAN